MFKNTIVFAKFSFLRIPAVHYSPASSESPYLAWDPATVKFAVVDFSKLPYYPSGLSIENDVRLLQLHNSISYLFHP